MTYKTLIKQSISLRKRDKALKQVLGNITISEWMVLGCIYDGATTVTSIAARCGSSLAFATNTVNTLENKGWVKRLHSNKDNRERKIVFIDQNAKFDMLEVSIKRVLNDGA